MEVVGMLESSKLENEKEKSFKIIDFNSGFPIS